MTREKYRPFALQRRVVASYNDFPKVLRDAILSTEDKDFERHWGINLWRSLGAAYRDLTWSPRTRCVDDNDAVSAQSLSVPRAIVSSQSS